MRLLLWLLLFPFITQAQSKDEQAVASTVKALEKALLDPTEAELTRLTSPALTYGHSNGLLEDRAAFIHALVSGDSDFTSIYTLDQTIKITGSTAWVRHTLKGTTHNKGQDPGKLSLSVLLVFVKEKSNWILLARQAVRIP